MGGVSSSAANDRHSSNRRSSQNNYNPPHGRGRSPYRGSNRKNNHAPSFSQDQHSRNNHNPHHGAQGHRTNSHNNPNANPNNKHNRRRHPRAASTDNADAEFDESTSIDDPFNSSFFSPRHTHNGVYKSKSNNNIRSCTECSSVRRANLRFRNWAVRALTRCNERFAAWANEVGVEFGTGDEMDWQPEPVVRVLLVSGDVSPTSTASLPLITQFTSMEGQQQKQQQEQIGPVPTPGPWAWPPWSAPTACPPPEAVPAQIQDGGGLATSQGNMPCDGLCGGDGNGTLSISGFGSLGVGCGELSGPLSNLNPDVGLNQ
ncbi:hypothetical protein GL218_07248 [Daldinia childiae]|uniref:uncharacterized protein n=1 Tax=Daldinia childiae TaxID=326645 RepID=UPI001444E4D9|nr:uncharacterized protein GL218_07248 [Daldinia childiae]KAF3056008.1 hypothetical protein GL218_07248 [Daldinia childiae]